MEYEKVPLYWNNDHCYDGDEEIAIFNCKTHTIDLNIKIDTKVYKIHYKNVLNYDLYQAFMASIYSSMILWKRLRHFINNLETEYNNTKEFYLLDSIEKAKELEKKLVVYDGDKIVDTLFGYKRITEKEIVEKLNINLP